MINMAKVIKTYRQGIASKKWGFFVYFITENTCTTQVASLIFP